MGGSGRGMSAEVLMATPGSKSLGCESGGTSMEAQAKVRGGPRDLANWLDEDHVRQPVSDVMRT